MTTVCRKCGNFVGLEEDTPRKDCWYNHFCKAHPLPVGIEPMQRNDLGRAYFTDQRFDYCRNHNDGNCKSFC